ncbi:hypothetical protein GCM10023219_03460 [Stakelama sediminis]
MRPHMGFAAASIARGTRQAGDVRDFGRYRMADREGSDTTRQEVTGGWFIRVSAGWIFRVNHA